MNYDNNDPFAVLWSDAAMVAPRLIGCILTREIDGQQMSGRIVEVEAYDQTDAASHSYRGETARTSVMFGPPGFVYVYFTYGMHYCMNVVTGPVGKGSAVLIRALEPLTGQDLMAINRRHQSNPVQLTNGPAKLCQALKIGPEFNGHDLHEPPLILTMQPPVPAADIVQTTRIGITKDAHRPWRFYLRGNLHISHV